MKKALMVVSFGTAVPDARQSIGQIEKELCAAMPGYDFYRAFTSSIVRGKIEREEGLNIPGAGELAEQLLAAGYEEVCCQSLHVMPGLEYEKMCRELAPYRDKFVRFTVGEPLLSAPEDCRRLCGALLAGLPERTEEEAWVYMGHGSEHFANAVYSELENQFRALGAERVYVATVEGFPGLDYIRGRLQTRQVRRVTLAPLMVVAGDHARNDLAGDEEDSWKSVLVREGCEVRLDLRGLGDFPAVREQFVDHCRNGK